MERRQILDYLARLHAEVDRLAAELAAPLPLRCGLGCCDCCVDELTVFEVEAARIREQHASLLAEAEPGVVGRCAFLDDEGACRVYAERPYVCRSQGLPLRWVEEESAEPAAEYRDICPLNEAVDPAALEPEQCWTLGPVEERLSLLQRLFAEQAGSDPGARVGLRGLFARTR